MRTGFKPAVRRVVVWFTALALLLTVCAAAFAAVRISSGRAESIALKRYTGKVIAATRLVKSSGQHYYYVTLRSKGVTRQVKISAKSGSVVSSWVTSKYKKPVYYKSTSRAQPKKVYRVARRRR